MNPYLQGLQVSLSALIITFLALGVFILIMILLQRLFPAQAEEGQESGDAPEEEFVLTVTSTDESEEGAVAAAIATALNFFQGAGREQLGGALREGRGDWWVSRRAQASQGKVDRR